MRESLAGQGRQGSAFITLLEDAALAGQSHTFEAGATIVEATQPARSVFLVRRGQVRTFLPGSGDDTRLMEILGPDDWFGTASIAGSAIWNIRAVAAAPTTVLEVAADKLLHAISQNPPAAVDLSRHLAQRMEMARQDAAGLIFQDCNSRLLDALIRFSKTAAATRCESGVVLRITHQQLAQAIGVARETVSLALTQLRQRGLVQTGRNQLTYDPIILSKSERLETVGCG